MSQEQENYSVNESDSTKEQVETTKKKRKIDFGRILFLIYLFLPTMFTLWKRRKGKKQINKENQK